ncbi:MAG: uracil-DNA glycosylase [Clostridia bacterium]|nr:uracil-DNA glycosylase [Clostridia bacterium]
MTTVNPTIEPGWGAALDEHFQAPYFAQLKEFLLQERQQHRVYPAGKNIFNAFNLTPFDKVKVVILGQDPYHGTGQAHGLCFSVMQGIVPPPSLVNIFKELQGDLGLPVPAHGDLSRWAQQGVLLLNATLTVRAGVAGSHQNKGWETFTDAAIQKLATQREHLVFLLWGNYAINKQRLINADKHCILTSPHPSPLSASRGFFGNHHFSKTNSYLKQHGIGEIDWRL